MTDKSSHREKRVISWVRKVEKECLREEKQYEEDIMKSTRDFVC